MLQDTVDEITIESYNNVKGIRTYHLKMAAAVCHRGKCISTLSQLEMAGLIPLTQVCLDYGKRPLSLRHTV